MKEIVTYIYGRNAVYEALRQNPTRVDGLWLSGHIQDPELIMAARSQNIHIHSLDEKKIKRQVGEGVVHQGVVARIPTAALTQSYKDFLEPLEATKDTLIVVLGELHDPQNVGAIIRSAAALGASAVLIPQYNQAPVNGTVVKVSAGAAFTIPLVTIGNVNQTLEDLKKKGFWIYGLAGDGDQSLHDETFSEPTVIVIGNEAEGLREKTREHCDIILSVPTTDKVESLNASSSATAALYAWGTRHSDIYGK